MAEKRPNILLFMPDQLRADAVGAFGNRVAKTPNIDALAARGTIFTQAYSQHSVCSPSRVSIFTSWYPHVRGHRTLTHLIKPWDPHLFKLFKEGGYTVAYAGMRGDDFAHGALEPHVDLYGYHVEPEMVYQPFPFPLDHKYAAAFYSGKRVNEAIDFDEAATQTAIEWIASGIKEPWLLYVPLVFPHPPFEAAEPWYSLHDRKAMPKPSQPSLDGKPRFMREIVERYGTDRMSEDDWAEIIATYYGMVSRVDDQLGRVLAAVERAGATERTAVAFFTDHGDYLGDFGLIEKWPSGVDDCLLRNPLILHAPGRNGGNTSNALVEMVDLLPTLLELAGIEAQHTHFGRSLVPLLDGAAAVHRDAVFAEGGCRPDEVRLLEPSGPPGLYKNKLDLERETPELVGRVVSIRTERWTYVRRLSDGDELYDRSSDPKELVNLSGQPEYEGIERGLRERILDWLVETSDVIPWEADPRFDPKLIEIIVRRLKGRR